MTSGCVGGFLFLLFLFCGARCWTRPVPVVVLPLSYCPTQGRVWGRGDSDDSRVECEGGEKNRRKVCI